MTNKLIAECCDRVGEVYASQDVVKAAGLTNEPDIDALERLALALKHGEWFERADIDDVMTTEEASFIERADPVAILSLIQRLRMAEAALRAQGGNSSWSIHFADGRDFCRYASLLIGAAYTHPQDALRRFDDGTLHGERTWGVVVASHPQGEEHGQG